MSSSISSLNNLLLNTIGLGNSQTGQSQPATGSQSGGFGAAVIMDLSPAALASLNGGTQSGATGSTSPLSNVASNIFSNMALTYSAGNTGTQDSNNSFFDQLFGSGLSTGRSGSATSGASANASSATGATGTHHGHHHHGGSQDALSQPSTSGTDSTSGDTTSSNGIDTLLSSLI